MPRRSRSPPPAAPWRAPPACAGLPGASCSCRNSLVIDLLRVEGVLQCLDEPVLSRRLPVLLRTRVVLTGLEHHGELPARDLVERVAQQADVLRLRDPAP